MTLNDRITQIAHILSDVHEKSGNEWVRAVELLDKRQKLIETYIRRYPQHTAALWDCLKVIAHTHADMLRHDRLWHQHATELLDRVIAGQPLSQATNVEVALALLDASKLAVLKHSAVLVILDAVQKVLNAEGRGCVIDQIKADTGIQEGRRGQLADAWARLEDVFANRIQRHEPNPNRWTEKVSLEVKRDVFKGMTPPADLMTPALWERDQPAPHKQLAPLQPKLF